MNIIPVYISKSSCKINFIWACCLAFVRDTDLWNIHRRQRILNPLQFTLLQSELSYLHKPGCIHYSPTTPPWPLCQPRSSALLVPNIVHRRIVGSNSIYFATYLCRQWRDLHQKTRLPVLKMDQATICSEYSFCEWRKTTNNHRRFSDWRRIWQIFVYWRW